MDQRPAHRTHEEAGPLHASQAEDVPEEQGSDDQVLSLFLLYKCFKHIMYINKHTPLMTWCVFSHFKLFKMFLLLVIVGVIFWPNYFTTDAYAKYQSELCIHIGEIVCCRCQVPLQKSNEKPVFSIY